MSLSGSPSVDTRITLAASDGNILRLVRDRCYFFFFLKYGDGRMMEPTIFSRLQIYKSTYEKTTMCLSFMMKMMDRFFSKMMAGASGPSCWVGHLCPYQSDFLQRPVWWISVCYPNYRSVVWLIMIVNSSRICCVVFPYPSCQWYSFHFLVYNGHWWIFTLHFQMGRVCTERYCILKQTYLLIVLYMFQLPHRCWSPNYVAIQLECPGTWKCLRIWGQRGIPQVQHFHLALPNWAVTNIFG